MRTLHFHEITQVSGARVTSFDAFGYGIGLGIGSLMAGFGVGNLAGGYFGYQLASYMGAGYVAATLGAGVTAVGVGFAGAYLLVGLNACLFTSNTCQRKGNV
ncbi:MAG: hypothetical protein AB7I18_11550 [Candidatus Berkiella sp.]